MENTMHPQMKSWTQFNGYLRGQETRLAVVWLKRFILFTIVSLMINCNPQIAAAVSSL